MRLIYITVPVGILFAAAGGALIYAAKTSAPISDEYKVLAQPRHPVTPEMWKQADSAKGVAAPEFQITDTDGTVRTLDDLTKDRPLFLYFVLEGCPCSIEAEPHYERLSQQFQGGINFLAVTNAKPDVAKKWKSEFAVPFPVVSQPGLELMNKFGVERAVYCLLIDKGGKIVSMWPGYSASMLQEVNQEMAAALHQTPRKFDSKEAPEIMTSGCAFVPGRKS
jgi:peroxiredoxin